MNQALFRRQFLQFLAASPLLAQKDDMKGIFSVMDFEARGKAAIPPAHWGYLSTGVDDDATLRANRAAFDKLFLRPRRMIDVTSIDTSVTLFGEKWDTPIILAPAGSQKAYHPEGEAASARAADQAGYLQILSTVTSTPIEEIAKLHRRKIWYQLYPTNVWANTERMVRRAEAVGCPVLVITVDTQGGRNTETESRSVALDSRPCSACHPVTKDGKRGRRIMPMFEGFQTENYLIHNPAQTWETIKRYRSLTKMKLILKGLETSEDARLAVEHGVDGIVVSNHGARAVESGRGTLDCLPEVIDAVGKRMPVLIDGGFRRGTDIFKAMALGASAVLIGRPYLWALGAYGEPGVAKVLQILRNEFALAMRQSGTVNIAAINRTHIGFHKG
ncbi:MAG: alpha-hydroxy-acid oxidizing protein [Acidobacteria bacterium]|nr:alpha-hydroxy-acid oxidizing protein [Acidobacteriota bacterium]